MAWYPERYDIQLVNYSDNAKEKIKENIKNLKNLNPHLDDLELKILEVICRYRGEAGLSKHSVEYLTSAVLQVVDEDRKLPHPKNYRP